MQKYISTLLFLLFTLTLAAQGRNDVEITLDNPNNSMYVHLYFLQKDSYDPGKASQALFTIKDSTAMSRKAIKLKQILDGSGLFVTFNKISSDPDYIDSLSQRSVFTPFPEEMPEVYLEKTNGKWYYSQETVERIPELHKKVYPFGADILLNLLPKMGQSEILGMALWQYFGLLIFLIFGYLVHFILSRALKPLVRKISKAREEDDIIHADLIKKIAGITSVLIVVRLIKLFLPVLLLPPTASAFAIAMIKVVTTILVVILIFRLLDIFMGYTIKFTETTESKMDEQLVPILRRSLQAIIIIGGIVQLLRIMDVNITALIAGLSIGGLALALAAQDTVKNLIGSAMVFFDRPFQIGDFIEYSGMSGIVLEVGFRSTRIQEADSSVISVPNGSIANAAISNKGVRVFRLFNINIGITYDTPLPLMKTFIEGLKKIVELHPNVKEEAGYIYLNSLGDSSINIMFRVPLYVPGYADELRVKEELLFSIIELAEQLGVRFAFPSTTLYMEEFPGSGSTAPNYETDVDTLQKRFDAFVEDKKTRL
jgi:MscS family membrane protein